jgi:hypothetical protein
MYMSEVDCDGEETVGPEKMGIYASWVGAFPLRRILRDQDESQT